MIIDALPDETTRQTLAQAVDRRPSGFGVNRAVDPITQQHRQDQTENRRIKNVRLYKHPEMDDAKNSRDIDQLMKPLPTFAAEAFDHSVCRRSASGTINKNAVIPNAMNGRWMTSATVPLRLNPRSNTKYVDKMNAAVKECKQAERAAIFDQLIVARPFAKRRDESVTIKLKSVKNAGRANEKLDRDLRRVDRERHRSRATRGGRERSPRSGLCKI